MQDHSVGTPELKRAVPSQAASTSEDRGMHGGEALHVPSTVHSGRDARDAGHLAAMLRNLQEIARQSEESNQNGGVASYNAAVPLIRRVGPYAGALCPHCIPCATAQVLGRTGATRPLLFVVPGAILLQALRVPRLVVSSFPVYVPCASLIVLLGSGLAVNLVGPLIGVAAPLRTAPLLIGVEFTSSVLLAISIKAPPSVMIQWHWPARPVRLAWPLILPLLAAVGALRLNNGHNDRAAVLAMSACAVLLITAAILSSSRLDESLLVVILYASCLAMMWSRSLRGVLVPGYDITSEYYDLHQTVLTGIWHTAQPHDAYGAMLSVTVLPAELHFLSGVPDLLIFSVIYPAIGALLPIAAV